MQTVTTCSSYEEFMKIHTGEANKEKPHVVVPLYMPIAAAVDHHVAMGYVAPKIRDEIEKGAWEMVAVAGGTMNDQGCNPEKVQFVLLYGKQDAAYFSFETLSDELELAVLMNGDGTRCFPKEPLPQQEAIIKWMAGFLNWNCECPGLYRLSYALVKQDDGKSTKQVDAATMSAILKQMGVDHVVDGQSIGLVMPKK